MSDLKMSRRGLLGALGVGAAAAALGGATSASAATVSPRVAFLGANQAGIATTQQLNLAFAALTVTTSSRASLVSLLQRWTTAAAALTQGSTSGSAFPALTAVPDDVGDAVDLSASNLTITIGFGPTLFRTAAGVDRFGIAAQQPSSFRTFPAFPGDQLDPRLTGGDLCIQACADDPQVAEHAVRTLVRIARGTAVLAWSQTGFNRPATGATTPRNLFGFKDGTANLRTADDLNQFVWVSAADGPAWMVGGTYLAARKIYMVIENWDDQTLATQQGVFGRTKQTGAPLSGGDERTRPDFRALGANGQPLIPVDSHVALAAPPRNNGQRILRRGYNFVEGADAQGREQAGLFFIAFARNLSTQFVPMQQQLSQSDRMNRFVRYVGSASFAVPPGVTSTGGYIGQTLFG